VKTLPYGGFSKTVSNALAGGRLITFDVYCELIAVFGPEVVPSPMRLIEVMSGGIQSVKSWPDDGSWEPRQTRPTMGLATSRAMKRLSGDGEPLVPEVPHPDADMAVAGLVVQLALEIDRWAGEGTSDALEVQVDVYVGQPRANLVVAGGMLTGEMWLTEDWGVRVAEEVRSPDGVFVLDHLGLDDVAGEMVPTYCWAVPLHTVDPLVLPNPVYLAIGDVDVHRYNDPDERWDLVPRS
jgi:hypothetical protein